MVVEVEVEVEVEVKVEVESNLGAPLGQPLLAGVAGTPWMKEERGGEGG